MVLLTLLDLSLNSTLWIAKNVFYAGRYMVYGRQKTKEEILEEKEDEILKRLEKVEELEKVIIHSQLNLKDYDPNKKKTDPQLRRRKSI